MKLQYFFKARPQIATLIMFGSILVIALVILLWLAGWQSVEIVFSFLDNLQKNPPLWLETPMLVGQFLFFPTIGFFLIAIGITKISPQPTHWSRVAVVSILLILVIRYLLWRSLSTLNLSDPLNGIFSLALYFFEVFVLFSSILQLVLMLKMTNRHQEADRLSLNVVQGIFQPSVDVLIPTYNEPEFILRRTIIGSQALDYPRKTIYVLDDTRRPEIAQLSRELGCEYMTRSDNRHAKAGNLNHALGKTNGDLIVVFDADFVPTRNFLKRTVGFFQEEKVALVQTPQSFYNMDPIARNSGLEEILTPEEEVFYRQLQPVKDAAGSVVCSGTSFVVRRKYLEEIGGFVTDSLSEDYFTGIRLSAQGYRLVYLDEKLSAGLAAESIGAHATQRLRWARGTLQAFFIHSNPLTIPGLTLRQRLAHLEGLLHWFSSFSTIFFLIMPLMYAVFNIIPIRATPGEIVYFFLPYYLTQITVFSWLNYRSRSAILSGVYSLILAFPLAITVIQVMFNPFSKGFQVTPKGVVSDRFQFNWKLAFPLLILFIVTAISLWSNIYACILVALERSPQLVEHFRGGSIGWIWSLYNLIIIGASLLILLDVPQLDFNPWFKLSRVVKITLKSDPTQEFWGMTDCISENQAYLALTQLGIPKLSSGETIPVELCFVQEKITLEAKIIANELTEEFPMLRVVFEDLTPEQRRQIIELLFCRPGQWKRRETPGELQSLWLLIKILLKPRVLFQRQPKIHGLRVSQV